MKANQLNVQCCGAVFRFLFAIAAPIILIVLHYNKLNAWKVFIGKAIVLFTFRKVKGRRERESERAWECENQVLYSCFSHLWPVVMLLIKENVSITTQLNFAGWLPWDTNMATAALCENSDKARIIAVCVPSTSSLYRQKFKAVVVHLGHF